MTVSAAQGSASVPWKSYLFIQREVAHIVWIERGTEKYSQVAAGAVTPAANAKKV